MLCYVILYIINANYKNHIYILLMNNIKSHINIIKKVWSKYNYYMSNTLLMKIIKKQYIRNILLMQIKKRDTFCISNITCKKLIVTYLIDGSIFGTKVGGW